jgi:hypothetical protein
VITSAPTDFSEILRSIAKNVRRARASWTLWSLLEGPDHRDEFEPAIKLCSNFFEHDGWQHLAGTITSTYRVFDTRANVAGLPVLLTRAETLTPIPTLTISQGRAMLDSNVTLIKKVALLRHKVFAHTDLHWSANRIYTEAGLTPNELASLQDHALALVNDFERLLGAPPTIFPTWPALDLHRLLGYLAAAAPKLQ